MDHLMRDQAPLRPEQWQALDEIVVRIARQSLVGRRFIPIYGPLGAGVQAVPDDRFRGSSDGAVDLLGDSESATVQLSVRRFLPLPLIYKDFILHWRDLQSSDQFGSPLDTSSAAAAAAACAHTEDDLIFNGNLALGLPGLLNVDGAQHLPRGNWNEAGEAFAAIVRASEALIAGHFFGPLTVVTSPVLFAQLNRMFENSGLLAIEQIQKLTRDGVYQSSALPEGMALVIAAAAENLDLAVAMDMTIGYEGPESLNHLFRVLESLVLRIKRPEAIVILNEG
jgi:uncharacterized linocin/CFP29 family protein